MDLSFYAAGAGASAQQTKLDIVANNIANVSTYGYKTKNASFSDLLYENIRESEDNLSVMRQGRGAKVEKTDTLLDAGAFYQTSSPWDFMIAGDGFFAIEHPDTNRVYYTRDGGFTRSENIDGNFYLVTSKGEFVLDETGNRIIIENEEDIPNIGIFDFLVRDGMTCVEGTQFEPVPKNGDPYLNGDSKLMRGYLELSNVNLASEMVKLIQLQRSYQFTLRMLQTADEIEGTINALRSQ